MNKYKRDSQSDVRFFCWLIGFSQIKARTKQFKYFHSCCERLLISPANKPNRVLMAGDETNTLPKEQWRRKWL